MYHSRNSLGPIDRFCAKHPRLGIPNLMLYLVIGQVVVFFLDLVLFRGELSAYWLPFNRGLILQGQLWRLVSFVIIPSSSNPFYLLLGCYFYFWIGQMLEREWGETKFTLFYLSGVVLSIVSGMLLGYAQIYYINLSIFLVIATIYSEMQVLLFFVLPIKMKWMAIIDVVLILVEVVQGIQMGSWVIALLPLASFINYFLFTWGFWAYKLDMARRRTNPKVVQFRSAQKKAEKEGKKVAYRHKCAVCGITDVDDPNMEFRYCSRCDGYYCYCAEHIHNHVHIHSEKR